MAKDGRYEKGRSGNPGGRPRALLDLQARCRERAPEAVDALIRALAVVELVGDNITPLQQARHRLEQIQISIVAAGKLLEWGYGKPAPYRPTDGIPDDVATLQRLLERTLHAAAVAGDTRALELALQAIDPAKYGKAEPKPPDTPDGFTFHAVDDIPK